MDIDRRKELIERVVRYQGEPASYFAELRAFGWDCESVLVILDTKDITHVLTLFSSGKISDIDVREWANFIERREDIELDRGDEKELNEVIFWLANPEINYDIDDELVIRIDELLIHRK